MEEGRKKIFALGLEFKIIKEQNICDPEGSQSNVLYPRSWKNLFLQEWTARQGTGSLALLVAKLCKDSEPNFVNVLKFSGTTDK